MPDNYDVYTINDAYFNDFPNFAAFNEADLDYFVVHGSTDSAAKNLILKSFSVYDMQAPNNAPIVSGSTKNGTEDTTLTFLETDFTGQFNDLDGTPADKGGSFIEWFILIQKRMDRFIRCTAK